MSPTDERIQRFLAMSGTQLALALAEGHPIEVGALDDSRYRGISLGLPGFVEALTWKTFEKTFHRDPVTGQLRGWNVRLEQTGWTSPPVPRQKGGQPWTFGHYDVKPGHPLTLDYGSARNFALDPTRLVRDPLVALDAGSARWLLGRSDLVGGLRTPSYFLLERLGPLEFLPR
jgi:hypothetical protein